MSEAVDFNEMDDDEKEAYIDGLKTQATKMGLDPSEADNLEDLIQMIAVKRDEIENGDSETNVPAPTVSQKVKKRLSGKNEAMALTRVEITSMNPNKRMMQHDTISAGNSVTKTVTRVFPFGKPTHLEKILLEALKQKKFSQDYSETDERTGREVTRFRLVTEYAINVLPPLTEEEIAELKQTQAARNNA